MKDGKPESLAEALLLLEKMNARLSEKDQKIREQQAEIKILNEKLAVVCNEITRERAKFLSAVTKSAAETMLKISHGAEELSLTYNCDSAVINPEDDNLSNIREHLIRRRDAELASGMCLIGSHRDDFTVKIGDKIARDFGSQGQIRSCVLALKCAEHEIIEKDSGEKPILLLDDVLSELDPKRRAFLINDVNRGQTIITGCDPSMFSELLSGKIFTIEKGKVKGSVEGKGM